MQKNGKGDLATSTFNGAHQSIGAECNLYLGGSEELKKKYLVPLAEGNTLEDLH